MAYMNQERKAALAPAIKAICKKYGVTVSIGVRHHSTLVINLKGGQIDFIGNYKEAQVGRVSKFLQENQPEIKAIDVNQYWYKEHFTGTALEFLTELFAAANNGNHDRSDIQTDYFDVGWYVDVNVGRWDKPYQLAA
jgi:hypothetical protein